MDKNVLINKYIDEKAEELNLLQHNIISKEKLEEIKQLFFNLPKPYDEIVKEIDALMEKIILLIKQREQQLKNILENIVAESFMRSNDIGAKYPNKEYSESISKKENELIEELKKKKLDNPTLTDIEFFKLSMVEFLTPVVEQIQREFNLPEDKKHKIIGVLNQENIIDYDSFYNSLSDDERKKCKRSDIQANSEKGKLIFDLESLSGNTIEEKIVSSMRGIIHETFHIIITLQKGPEAENKRFFYNARTTNGKISLHFPSGKYGQIINEGFVEKLSSEFASRNNFFHVLNPRYIQYVKLVNYIMATNPNISPEYLFNHNITDLLSNLSTDDKKKIEETERLASFNHFKVKELGDNPQLLGITTDNIESTFTRTKDIETEPVLNKTYKAPFKSNKIEDQTIINTNLINNKDTNRDNENNNTKMPYMEDKSFTNYSQIEISNENFGARSEEEVAIAQKLREKNKKIHDENKKENSKKKEKQNVKVLKMNPPKTSISDNKGSINISIILILALVLTLLIILILKG